MGQGQQSRQGATVSPNNFAPPLRAYFSFPACMHLKLSNDDRKRHRYPVSDDGLASGCHLRVLEQPRKACGPAWIWRSFVLLSPEGGEVARSSDHNFQGRHRVLSVMC